MQPSCIRPSLFVPEGSFPTVKSGFTRQAALAWSPSQAPSFPPGACFLCLIFMCTIQITTRIRGRFHGTFKNLLHPCAHRTHRISATARSSCCCDSISGDRRMLNCRAIFSRSLMRRGNAPQAGLTLRSARGRPEFALFRTCGLSYFTGRIRNHYALKATRLLSILLTSWGWVNISSPVTGQCCQPSHWKNSAGGSGDSGCARRTAPATERAIV